MRIVVKANYPFNQKVYMVKLHTFTWRNQAEVMAAPIYLDLPAKRVYTPNDELSEIIGLNDWYISDPALLETITSLYPYITSTVDLYMLYLETKYPVYSYH